MKYVLVFLLILLLFSGCVVQENARENIEDVNTTQQPENEIKGEIFVSNSEGAVK